MAVLFFLLLLAVLFDFGSSRIPNFLIVSVAGWSILYRGVVPGGKSLIFYIGSMIILFFILIPLFRLKVIAGGDVKLLSACACYTGLQSGMSLVLYSFFFGAILSFFKLVYHRLFSKQRKNTKHYIHFSLPIFLGAVAEHIWGGMLWQIF